MATSISSLLNLSKLSRANLWRSRHLACYVPKRNVQEFPGLRYDNSTPKDYVLVLPEPINEDGNTNELLRLPKVGEPETDFSKLNPEKVFKGLSQTICVFENFLTDVNNEIAPLNKTIGEIFKDIGQNLYPMDVAFNIYTILSNVKWNEYSHDEFHQLINRYFAVKEKRLEGIFKESIQRNLVHSKDKLTPADRRMIRFYQIHNPKRQNMRPIDESSLFLFRENLRNDFNLFLRNLNCANELFSHIVDDPDILAAVSNEFDDCQYLHHKERTPLQITIGTYQKFMQVCPDRFVRQMLWQTHNKRCSPKASPRYNNKSVIGNIRVLRRKIADLLGYRTHVEYRLENTMALSRQKVLDSLRALNEQNSPKLNDRLQELNDYASDNAFEDPSQLGIQEYDVDFWTHKYMYEILIGTSEANLKAYFPLNIVIEGLQHFFKSYFGVEINQKPNQENKFWSKNVILFEVSRKGQPLGNIIYDPYQGSNNKLTELSIGRVRDRNQQDGYLPARFISTPFKVDQTKKEAHLSFSDIVDLFYCYGVVIQRLLYNYKYYELNIHGGLEEEVTNLLPHLCVAHLLSDHRILQSCSDRGGSKPIDSELATRILRAFTYFKPLRTWNELYKAHFDLEAHTVLMDTKDLADEIYSIYSPFRRDPDDYDFCTMSNIFVAPNDGTQYANIWSKQLANFCISQVQDTNGKLDDLKTKEFYDKLIDCLFDQEAHDTAEKLVSLVGHRFELAKPSLGVL